MTTIYTLELENNKYYVGRTNSPKNRILDHFHENGSEWTKKYKPINVISEIIGDSFDEEKYTLIAIEKYGVDNVRGGSYCKIELSDFEKEKALQTIRSIMDKCYKCGIKGHFAKECNKSIKNKQKPNEKCLCGSDIKFKKCCGSDNNTNECELEWLNFYCNKREDCIYNIYYFYAQHEPKYFEIIQLLESYAKYKNDITFNEELINDALDYGKKNNLGQPTFNMKDGIHHFINSMKKSDKYLYNFCNKYINKIDFGED
jgi:uncharacterized protein YchJ